MVFIRIVALEKSTDLFGNAERNEDSDRNRYRFGYRYVHNFDERATNSSSKCVGMDRCNRTLNPIIIRTFTRNLEWLEPTFYSEKIIKKKVITQNQAGHTKGLDYVRPYIQRYPLLGWVSRGEPSAQAPKIWLTGINTSDYVQPRFKP